MEITLKLNPYNPSTGISLTWQEGFRIEAYSQNNQVLIRANRAGLESLANHFLNLSQHNVPEGSHIHFDSGNSLEDGSSELIIERLKD
jgi:hypothetical protein